MLHLSASTRASEVCIPALRTGSAMGITSCSILDKPHTEFALSFSCFPHPAAACKHQCAPATHACGVQLGGCDCCCTAEPSLNYAQTCHHWSGQSASTAKWGRPCRPLVHNGQCSCCSAEAWRRGVARAARDRPGLGRASALGLEPRRHGLQCSKRSQWGWLQGQRQHPGQRRRQLRVRPCA